MNAVLYFGWLAYGYALRDGLRAGQLGNLLGNYIAVPLTVASLICAIAGEGKPRLLVGLASVLGFLIWIQGGVL